MHRLNPRRYRAADRAQGRASVRRQRRAASPGVVVVRGERIVAVGARSAPAGARVIDLGDATLVPGYIDAHTHIAGDYDETGRTVSTSDDALPVEQAFHAEHKRAHAAGGRHHDARSRRRGLHRRRAAQRDQRRPRRRPAHAGAGACDRFDRRALRWTAVPPGEHAPAGTPTACATAPIRAAARCASK